MAPKNKTPKKRGAPEIEFSGRILALMDSYEGCGTVTDLCEYLGVKNTTFYKWLNGNDEFAEAVTRARAFTNDAVENAMLKRALGFEYVETTEKVEDVPGQNESGGRVSYTTTKKYVPGDVGAQKNWLVNRDRERWSDRKTVEITGNYHDLLAKFADDGEDKETDNG